MSVEYVYWWAVIAGFPCYDHKFCSFLLSTFFNFQVWVSYLIQQQVRQLTADKPGTE